jgi:hypothetical protein
VRAFSSRFRAQLPCPCTYIRLSIVSPGIIVVFGNLSGLSLGLIHEVTVKGKVFVVPGIDVGQTHSGSLEGKSTFIVWKLAPRRKSVKQVVNVTFPPALSHPLLTLFPRHWISSPTSAFIVRRFCLFACFLDF